MTSFAVVLQLRGHHGAFEEVVPRRRRGDERWHWRALLFRSGIPTRI